MDKETLKTALRTKTAEEIYSEHFISGEIWIFKKIFHDHWFEKYDEFRKYVAEKLGVHYNNIGIAGSAKLGVSMNPDKNYKQFDSDSDIDIIIVSPKLFEEFWEQYLQDSYRPTTRINNITKVSFCIFRRYLTLDGFRKNEYYMDWVKKTKGFEKDIQIRFQIDNDIHYRIFESWDAVKMYYLSSIEDLKSKEET